MESHQSTYKVTSSQDTTREQGDNQDSLLYLQKYPLSFFSCAKFILGRMTCFTPAYNKSTKKGRFSSLDAVDKLLKMFAFSYYMIALVGFIYPSLSVGMV